jgi:predicted transcriptional regulator
MESLPSAVGGVDTVSPSEALAVAVTKMLTQDFSQLPVMTTERSIKGVISWKSIGTSFQLVGRQATVSDCMDKNFAVVYDDDRILKVLQIIIEYDFVFVKDRTEKVCGICTTADLSEMFQSHSEPFIHIEQIDTTLRSLIGSKFEGSSLSHGQDCQNSVSFPPDVNDFSFGDYVRWLEKEDNWQLLELNVDRRVLVERLIAVNQTRNKLMHFRVEGLEYSEILELQRVSKFLRLLTKMEHKRRASTTPTTAL